MWNFTAFWKPTIQRQAVRISGSLPELHHTRRQNTPSPEANTSDATICATLNKCSSMFVTTVKHNRRCETHVRSKLISTRTYVHFWTQAIHDIFRRPCYLSRVDHVRKVWDRKQRTDIGKYSFVNRTIKNCKQLPAEVLRTFRCKAKIYRKRVRISFASHPTCTKFRTTSPQRQCPIRRLMTIGARKAILLILAKASTVQLHLLVHHTTEWHFESGEWIFELCALRQGVYQVQSC